MGWRENSSLKTRRGNHGSRGVVARKLGARARETGLVEAFRRGFPIRRFRYSAAVPAPARDRGLPATTSKATRREVTVLIGSPAVETAAAVALLASAVLGTIVARRIGASIDGPRDVAFAIAGALAGLIVCDLVSGVVHWACDTFFAETTPVIGGALIAPFREHHRDPLAMTRRRFLDVNSSNCFVVLPFLVYAAWRDVAIVQDAFILAFAPATILTNQFHQWAHARQVPSWVRWLQRVRVVLPPEAHARHHGAAHGSSYCVTAGWLNPMLDRLDVFGRLERGIRACRRVSIADGGSSRLS